MAVRQAINSSKPDLKGTTRSSTNSDPHITAAHLQGRPLLHANGEVQRLYASTVTVMVTRFEYFQMAQDQPQRLVKCPIAASVSLKPPKPLEHVVS